MTFVPVYILVLGFTIVVDYFAGLLIEKSSGRLRRQYLILGIITNIGVLAIFKYYNFFNENLSALSTSLGYDNNLPYLNLLLPLGLSFHTFQALSYLIEVYRGNQQAERHMGIYAVYIMFYPQLVAGPIERPQNMLHQFRIKQYLNYENVGTGLKLILWGLFKKIVIADRLAVYVDAVYDNVGEHSAITLIIATVFFTFQIYCDFSGYSDIAVGCARVLGIRLMFNFRRPYLSKSILEFWSRWHISLSTWFRDYLYFPLGGSRVSNPRWHLNIFIVFLISGLWHGADWTFVIWGALHGLYLIISNIFADPKKRHQTGSFKRIDFIKILITFSLVCFTRIFFRANSVSDAIYVIKSIFLLKPGALYLGTPSGFAYAVLWILFLMVTEIIAEYWGDRIKVFNSPFKSIRYLGYATILVFIILFGVFNGTQFIYFQF